MTDLYKKELISRSVAAEMPLLLDAIDRYFSDVDRLDVLREIRESATVLARRMRADRAWAEMKKRGDV